MTTATEYAIDTNLGIQISARKYGCLQSKFHSAGHESFPFCIDPATEQKLDPGSAELLGLKECTAYNKDGESYQMFEITSPFRVVFLGIPPRSSKFVENKTTKRVETLKEGMKLGSKTYITVARLPLLLLVNHPPDENGESAPQFVLNGETYRPQIMTLKLKSNATGLIEGNKRYPQIRNLVAANEAIVQKNKGKVGSSLLHCASFELVIETTTFRSVTDGQESSAGIFYNLKGDARTLPPLLQTDAHEEAISQDVKNLLTDPFGVLRRINSESSYNEVGYTDEF